MPIKVLFNITKGYSANNIYQYSQKESLIIGRHEDCHININSTDYTVSRRHCLIEIAPPLIRVRDFGSKNGTYLNGEKIGQRGEHQSPEEGQKYPSLEFDVNSGDCYGKRIKKCQEEILGKTLKIRFSIWIKSVL